MTNQERDNQTAIEAVDQLTTACQFKNAEQLAELEASLTVLGLSKLAGIVFRYGIGNAGDEYINLRSDALQAKFN